GRALPRRRGTLAGRVGRVRIRIADREREPLRVGGPFVALQPTFDLGQLRRLAAAPIEQPDLIAFGLARARRSEGQIFPVRAEARRRLAVAAPRDLPFVLAVDADGPDVSAAGLVFLHVDL